MILHVGARIRWVPRCGERAAECVNVLTPPRIYGIESRGGSVLVPLSLSLSLSLSLPLRLQRSEGAKGWPGVRGRVPDCLPCGISRSRAGHWNKWAPFRIL